jgi:GTPase SAR1 family protein
MAEPRIILIGTEASGKTVLTTVIVERNKTLFVPVDNETASYTTGLFHQLQNGESLQSTPTGSLFNLNWNLHIWGMKYPVQIIDSAGQDLRKLCKLLNADNGLPSTDQKYVDSIRQASILIVLLNIGDFIGISDPKQRMETEMVLVQALNNLQNRQDVPRVALVFTKADQYKTTLAKYGNCRTFVKKELQYLYQSGIRGRFIPMFSVAAIAQTRTVVNEKGRTETLPEKNFTSEGLESLVNWIKKTALPISTRICWAIGVFLGSLLGLPIGAGIGYVAGAIIAYIIAGITDVNTSASGFNGLFYTSVYLLTFISALVGLSIGGTLGGEVGVQQGQKLAIFNNGIFRTIEWFYGKWCWIWDR